VRFIDLVAALMWARRLRPSATCVPRLSNVIEAWLSAVVSPLARSETGTAATIDVRGSSPRAA
jgi:hypothetical protein